MIRKFISIENVGKFRSCKAAGDVELRPLSLIYAENGRGKTTLCDILRSLRDGNGDYIRGRATLGASTVPTVEVRLEDSTATFDGSAWSETLPDLRIFDSLFVHQNVYAGELVEHEQKRGLYRVIVGEKGVELATKVDSLDALVRAADNTMKAAKTPVAHFAPPTVSVDDYIALSEDPDIVTKIASKEAVLVVLRRSEEVASKALLSHIDIPALPTTLPTTVAKDLEDVSAATEQIVHDHLANHTAKATEPWLAQGIELKEASAPSVSRISTQTPS